jgi:hypothetical protein
MRLYFHSSNETMVHVLRDGFTEEMSRGTGIRLMTTSPVVSGEPVLVVDIPDDVAARHGRAFRPGEYIFHADVLNWFPVREESSRSRLSRLR